MNPIHSKIILMSKNGRITIPKSIREIYGLRGTVGMEIRLMSDHTILLIPQAPWRERFLKKWHPSKADGDE